MSILKEDHLLTIWDVGDQSIEAESPSQGIRQTFLELIHLEVLIANSLLIDSNPPHCHDPLLLGQELSIQLIIRHEI